MILKDIFYLPFFVLANLFIWRMFFFYKNLYCYQIFKELQLKIEGNLDKIENKELKNEENYDKINRIIEESLNREAENGRLELIYIISKGIWDILYTLECFIVLISWRLPTFIQIYNANSNKNAIKVQKDENKPQEKLKFFEIIHFVFKEILKDFIYLPFFIIANVFIWRMFSFYKKVYCYKNFEKKELKKEIEEGREELGVVIYEGVLDVLFVISLLCVIVTIVRLPFLYWLYKKNLQLKKEYEINKDSLEEKKVLVLENGKYIEKLEKVQKKSKPKLLSFRKCVFISFFQLIRDLPFIPLSLILIIFAPWSIYSLYYILISQKKRLPTTQNIKNIPGRRKEIFQLFKRIIIYDYPVVFMSLVLFVSFVKSKKCWNVWILFFDSLNLEAERKYDVRYELFLQMQDLLKVLPTCGYSIGILILVIRIKKCYKRLSRLKTAKELKLKEIALLSKIETSTGHKNRAYQQLTFHSFEHICLFLNTDDLANLRMTCKKFDNYFFRPIIWQSHYNINYSNWTSNEIDWELKCIDVFKKKKMSEGTEEISIEKKDQILGYENIVFEEFLLSIVSIPKLIAYPYSILLDYSHNSIITFSNVNLQGLKFIINFLPSRELVQAQENLTSHYNAANKKISPGFVLKNFILYLFLIFYKVFFKLGYYITLPIYLGLNYTKTDFYYSPNIAQNNPPFFYTNREARGEIINLHMTQSKKNFLLTLQTLHFFLSVFYYFCLFLMPIVFFWVCTNLPVLRCIIGPYFINFGIWICVFISIISFYDLWMYIFIRYNPFEIPISVLYYIKNRMVDFKNYTNRTIMKPLYDKFVKLCKLFVKLLKFNLTILSTIWKFLKNSCGSLWKGLKSMMKTGTNLTFGNYVFLLEKLTIISLKFGIVGDALLTFFALGWMFWPLYFPVYFGKKILFLPMGVIAMGLLVVGYKKINVTWNKYKR